MNVKTDRPKKKLRHVKQEDNETFESFSERWRKTAAAMDTPPSEKQQIDLMIENLNSKYFTAFASKTFSTMEKVKRIGANFDEAFKREKVTELAKPYTSSKPYSQHKPKADVHYVANTWTSQKRDEKRFERPKYEKNLTKKTNLNATTTTLE